MLQIYRSPILPDVYMIEPQVFGDDRGFFFESFRLDQLEQTLKRKLTFVQDNHSRSIRGVLRGLHYQIYKAQGKLVRVVQGEVFDVAVDMRQSSPMLGRWLGVHLSAENKKQLWIPEGFAHGFLVLSESAEFVYKTTDYYTPAAERCLLWNDPQINIHWPLQHPPILAPKDLQGKRFKEAEKFL